MFLYQANLRVENTYCVFFGKKNYELRLDMIYHS